MKWYYVDNGQRVGPLQENEMCALAQRNELGRQTKIWRKGMSGWQSAEEVAPNWFAGAMSAAVVARSSGQARQGGRNGAPASEAAPSAIQKPPNGTNAAVSGLGGVPNGGTTQMMMCSACGTMEHQERMTQRNGAFLCASCAAGHQAGSRRRHHRRPVHQGHVKNAAELWTRLMEDHFRELILLGVTLLCVLGMFFSWRNGGALDFPFRTVAATCYLLVAFACGALDSKYGKAMLLGLFCCWIGSLALGIIGGGPLLVGLGAYLAGHCLFAAAFWLRGIPNTFWRKGTAIFIALTVVLSGYGCIFCVQASYRPFVVAYGMISAATFVLAFGAYKAGRLGLLGFAGTCALLASDAAIMQVRFVKPGLIAPAIALVAYYAALHMLAFSTAYEFESAHPAPDAASS